MHLPRHDQSYGHETELKRWLGACSMWSGMYCQLGDAFCFKYHALAKQGTFVVGKAASIMRPIVQIAFLGATVEVQQSGPSTSDAACILKELKTMTKNLIIYIALINDDKCMYHVSHVSVCSGITKNQRLGRIKSIPKKWTNPRCQDQVQPPGCFGIRPLSTNPWGKLSSSVGHTEVDELKIHFTVDIQIGCRAGNYPVTTCPKIIHKGLSMPWIAQVVSILSPKEPPQNDPSSDLKTCSCSPSPMFWHSIGPNWGTAIKA